MNKRVILHIDFDSFFASVEQQYNPSLRNKPIGVTATNGRTCIIAASREAKKYGIKTGSRSFEAFQVCPTLTLVPADFVKYFEVSKKFLSICKDYSFLVELFSIDEVFMDVSSTNHLFGGTYSLIKRIKSRLKTEVGEYVTASVGISHNKLLAKLASGLKKPNGVVEINEYNRDDMYKKAQLTDICGIGERIQKRLQRIGIYTLLGLKNIPIHYLLAEFWLVEGTFLKNVGLGIDRTELIPYTTSPLVKSVGRNYCLPKNEYNIRVILQTVFELCEEVGLKLRRLGKKAKTIGLALGGSLNFHDRKTTAYINCGDDIFLVCRFMVNGWLESTEKYHVQKMVRQVSVWAENLVDVASLPLSLFEYQTKKNMLTQTIDAINQKFGDHTIRNAFLLYADKLTTVPNGYMADKYERTKLAQEL